jgi:hypothetical protein
MNADDAKKQDELDAHAEKGADAEAKKKQNEVDKLVEAADS